MGLTQLREEIGLWGVSGHIAQGLWGKAKVGVSLRGVLVSVVRTGRVRKFC